MTKPITYFHVGRRVPKGFVEVGRGIHLGKGIWLLRMVKAAAAKKLLRA